MSLSVMLVKKRDERVETFKCQKIYHGIEMAEKTLYGELSKQRKEEIDRVTKKVLSKIETLAKSETK